MDLVYCVDCNFVVTLVNFSKDHKRHEMKLLDDLLEEKKNDEIPSSSLILESIFKTDEYLTKTNNLVLEAEKLKQNLADNCIILVKEIQKHRDSEFARIDRQLSIVKNEFSKSIENKLEFENTKKSEIVKYLGDKLNSNDKKKIEDLNKLLNQRNFTINDLNPNLNLEIVSFKEFIKKYFPFVKLIPLPSDNTTTEKDLSPTVLQDDLSETSSNFSQVSSQEFSDSVEPDTYKIETSFYKLKDKSPYMLYEDCCYLYACYTYWQKIDVYSKSDKKYLKSLKTSSQPCRVVSIGNTLYYIDSKKMFLHKIDENKKETMINLKFYPQFIYKNPDGDILLTSGKNVTCYNVASGNLFPVDGTSQIGFVHRWWSLGQFSIAEVSKNKKLYLVKLKDSKFIKQFDLPTSAVAKLSIDFDGNKMICMLNRVKKSLTLFDVDLNVIENILVRLHSKEEIKNISFENHGKIILTIYNKESHVCKVLKYYDFFTPV